MVPSKVLILHEPDHQRSSLAAALPKDDCDVIEISIDNDLNGLNIEDCCVIILDVVSVSHRILDLCSLLRNRNASATLLVVGKPVPQGKRIATLDAGSDAYLTKPVAAPELQARIRTALRRINGSRMKGHRRFHVGGRLIEFDMRSVTLKGHGVHLTPIEWHLLESLASRLNQTVPGHDLVQRIWGPASTKGVHSLRVFIKSLRKKLEPDPKCPRYIITTPSIGYRLQIPGKP